MGNVLFVDKPKGITSFDVCYRLRKVLGTRKIGHTGTLDPGATGVMVILFDKATKANQFLVSDSKEYECEVIFGIKTDTLDMDGNILETCDYTVPDEISLISTLNSFLGESRQQVPLTSAISVDGKRLYEYQRKNIEVEIPVRDINVYDIELLEIGKDGFKFKCTVSSGTYIRALVRDICNKLGIPGSVKQLRRTKIDNIDISMCDELEEIEKGNYTVHNLYDLLKDKYEVVEYDNLDDIYNGKRIKIDSKASRILISHNQEALAVYEKDNDVYKSVRGLW